MTWGTSRCWHRLSGNKTLRPTSEILRRSPRRMSGFGLPCDPPLRPSTAVVWREDSASRHGPAKMYIRIIIPSKGRRMASALIRGRASRLRLIRSALNMRRNSSRISLGVPRGDLSARRSSWQGLAPLSGDRDAGGANGVRETFRGLRDFRVPRGLSLGGLGRLVRLDGLGGMDAGSGLGLDYGELAAVRGDGAGELSGVGGFLGGVGVGAGWWSAYCSAVLGVVAWPCC